MTLAFGETLSALASLTIFLLCSSIIFRYILRLRSKQKASKCSTLIAALSSICLITMISSAVINGNRDYNPYDTSLSNIIGIYQYENSSITLKPDHTYSTHNVKGMSEGSWNNDDWNLTFTNSELSSPRYITRNGESAVLPYYSGVDGPDGNLFVRVSKSPY